MSADLTHQRKRGPFKRVFTYGHLVNWMSHIFGSLDVAEDCHPCECGPRGVKQFGLNHTANLSDISEDLNVDVAYRSLPLNVI